MRDIECLERKNNNLVAPGALDSKVASGILKNYQEGKCYNIFRARLSDSEWIIFGRFRGSDFQKIDNKADRTWLAAVIQGPGYASVAYVLGFSERNTEKGIGIWEDPRGSSHDWRKNGVYRLGLTGVELKPDKGKDDVVHPTELRVHKSDRTLLFDDPYVFMGCIGKNTLPRLEREILYRRDGKFHTFDRCIAVPSDGEFILEQIGEIDYKNRPLRMSHKAGMGDILPYGDKFILIDHGQVKIPQVGAGRDNAVYVYSVGASLLDEDLNVLSVGENPLFEREIFKGLVEEELWDYRKVAYTESVVIADVRGQRMLVADLNLGDARNKTVGVYLDAEVERLAQEKDAKIPPREMIVFSPDMTKIEGNMEKFAQVA